MPFNEDTWQSDKFASVRALALSLGHEGRKIINRFYDFVVLRTDSNHQGIAHNLALDMQFIKTTEEKAIARRVINSRPDYFQRCMVFAVDNAMSAITKDNIIKIILNAEPENRTGVFIWFANTYLQDNDKFERFSCTEIVNSLRNYDYNSLETAGKAYEIARTNYALPTSNAHYPSSVGTIAAPGSAAAASSSSSSSSSAPPSHVLSGVEAVVAIALRSHIASR